ncbi:MAG: hypothetical protein GX905_02700 [Bacteroidales bacterium]|nr:hypothetical protein [Bacteroidales bacterium]
MRKKIVTLTFILSLLLIHITLLTSCNKEDINNEPSKVKEPSTENGSNLSINGVWIMEQMDNGELDPHMYRFSFFENNEASMVLHGESYDCTYIFIEKEGVFYIQFNMPSVGKDKAQGYIILKANTYDGEKLEGVTVYIEKNRHGEQEAYRMIRQDISRFENSFFDLEWEVTSNTMQVEQGILKTLLFKNDGSFIGSLDSGENIQGTFNKKHILLNITTKYGINDFELSFLSFENEEKTQIKVGFWSQTKKNDITAILQKR